MKYACSLPHSCWRPPLPVPRHRHRPPPPAPAGRGPQPAPPRLPSCPELAAAVQAAVRNDVRLRDWPDLARYREANRSLAAPAPGEARVVFMGDSITDAWPQPRFGAFFPGKPYIGRGISGQTTPQMLIRFRPDVIALRPKAVVILAGTNDIAGNTGPMTDEQIAGQPRVDGRAGEGQRHPRRLLEHPAGERLPRAAGRHRAAADDEAAHGADHGAQRVDEGVRRGERPRLPGLRSGDGRRARASCGPS